MPQTSEDAWEAATKRAEGQSRLNDGLYRLLPCPFCGSEAEIITLEGETDEPSIGAQCVQCTNHGGCGAASGLIYPLGDDVTELLRERWNKRSNV
jgi:hypothetical protein